MPLPGFEPCVVRRVHVNRITTACQLLSVYFYKLHFSNSYIIIKLIYHGELSLYLPIADVISK